MIDIHSHILPGVDDGARNLETSLEMARIAVADGIKEMITTPHLFRGTLTLEDLDNIDKARETLAGALKERNIPLELYSGIEVHISHDLFDEIKKQRNRLVLNRSVYILIEFPSDHVFSGVKDLFFELMTEGLIPIITHPERNSVFRNNPKLLFELIRMGVLAQANCGSLVGLYGSRAQEAVFRFLESNLIQFIASDCHNTKASAPRLSQAVKQLNELLGEEHANALVENNPQAVLLDRDLPNLPEPQDPTQGKKSLKIKLPKIWKRK